MNADTLGILLALIISFGTAAGGVVTAWRRAPSENVSTLLERVENLENRVSARDKTIDHLAAWQVAARMYILTLRSALADRGIASPVPPPELEIYAGDGEARA